jgi:hypothetical protein
MENLLIKTHGVSPFDDVYEIYVQNNGNYRGLNDDHLLLEKT